MFILNGTAYFSLSTSILLIFYPYYGYKGSLKEAPDIALLELAESVTFGTKINAICLPSEKDVENVLEQLVDLLNSIEALGCWSGVVHYSVTYKTTLRVIRRLWGGGLTMVNTD